MLDLYLQNGEGEKAWALLEAMPEERKQDSLLRTVCEHYWWLTGELFDLFGDMGWGPGFNREWDTRQSDLPPKAPEADFRLKQFVMDLAQVPREGEVRSVVEKARRTEDKSLVVRAMRYMLDFHKRTIGRGVLQLYGTIASRRTEYEIGMARMFLSLFTRHKEVEVPMAGMLLILTRKMERRKVLMRRLSLSTWKKQPARENVAA